MITRIFKWELQLTDEQVLWLPKGSKLLTVQMQNGRPKLWAICDPNAVLQEPRRIGIYGTGNPIPEDPGIYIATFQMHNGDLVFHVFEGRT